VQAQDFRKLLSQMPRNASTRVPFRSVTAISLSGFSGSELLFNNTFQWHYVIVEKYATEDAECKIYGVFVQIPWFEYRTAPCVRDYGFLLLSEHTPTTILKY